MSGRIGLLIASITVLAIAPTWAADKLSGSIRGSIDPSVGAVKAVAAVSRVDGRRLPGKHDLASGAFEVGDLAFDAVYDVIVDFADARLEGVNLNVPRSDYAEELPLSAEDIEIIRSKALRMNTFEDIVEIRTIQGNIQHAAVLLNKRRTKPFFGSKPGEVIWRVELWHFERPEETWVKVQDELAIVLYRERIQSSAYSAKSHTFDQALGGIRPTSEQPTIELGSVKGPIAKRGIHFRASEPEAPTGPNQ